MERALGSRYVIEEVLGRGATGEVWRGRSHEGGEFAVKILHDTLARDPDTVQRFLREGSILTGVVHPNLVRVHDLVAEGETLAIVMDLIPGSDLRRPLSEHGTMRPGDACQVGAQTAAALAAIHEAGVVHRDVKPENVLLDRRTSPPAVRLTDFGIARIAEQTSSKSTMLVGTAPYIAPELADGKPATAATDLYALGIMLYEMCCGVTPFADGVLMLPLFGVIRQCIAAAVPPEQRRTGFALDSMLVEVAYMVGPAMAAACATVFGGGWTMVVVGVGLVGSGSALLLLNPPTRTEEEKKRGDVAVPRREWLTPALFALLGITFACTFVLIATELSLVAALKAADATSWVGPMIALWCFWSLLGGFVYGGMSRRISPLVMVGVMAALTVPVGLVGDWRLLCVALIPAGVICAPAISASIDMISQWVPTGARGEAMGLHGTALTLGLAVSGPITGYVIDDYGTHWSLTFAGVGGLVLVALALPFWRRRRTPVTTVPDPVPA